jgi:CBS domain-containing protein
MNLVRHFMAADVETVQSDTPVEEVARIMAKGDIGAVPVVDDGQLRGLITDRDIVVRMVAEGRDASSTRATDVASPEVVTVSPDQNISEARELMREHRVRRLPVAKAGELVGIIALGDLAVQDPSERSTGETLREISRSVDTETENVEGTPPKGTPSRVENARES